MNCQTFSQNPCMQGKSHHHMAVTQTIGLSNRTAKQWRQCPIVGGGRIHKPRPWNCQIESESSVTTCAVVVVGVGCEQTEVPTPTGLLATDYKR